MTLMEFSREEYKDIVAPFLATLKPTDYVSYYPEHTVIILDNENASFLRMMATPRRITELGKHISDKKS